MLERNLVVIEPTFKLCAVIPTDSARVDDIANKTCTMQRAKVFFYAITQFLGLDANIVFW